MENLIADFEDETEGFRQLLDNRNKEEMARDAYILEQHSKNKKWKVIFRKASKKFEFPEPIKGTDEFDYWVEYYETFVRIILYDLYMDRYEQNLETIESIRRELEENEARQ